MQFIISLHDFLTHVLKHDTLKKASTPLVLVIQPMFTDYRLGAEETQ